MTFDFLSDYCFQLNGKLSLLRDQKISLNSIEMSTKNEKIYCVTETEIDKSYSSRKNETLRQFLIHKTLLNWPQVHKWNFFCVWRRFIHFEFETFRRFPFADLSSFLFCLQTIKFCNGKQFIFLFEFSGGRRESKKRWNMCFKCSYGLWDTYLELCWTRIVLRRQLNSKLSVCTNRERLQVCVLLWHAKMEQTRQCYAHNFATGTARQTA